MYSGQPGKASEYNFLQQQPGAQQAAGFAGMPTPPPGVGAPQVFHRDYDRHAVSVVYMPVPAVPLPGCPSGLEYLTMIDHLFVKQQVEIMELLTGFETSNKYAIYNRVGQLVYCAFEESDCCARQCFHGNRSFVMHITDNFGREVMRVNRPSKCCVTWGCAAPCWAEPFGDCSTAVYVESPPGVLVGSVQQRKSLCVPNFVILDSAHRPVLKIEGPSCAEFSFTCNPSFLVQTIGGDTVGTIRKEFSGLLQECMTDADNFGITFPMDLAVETKATLIGATFLIDFMEYEQYGGCR